MSIAILVAMRLSFTYEVSGKVYTRLEKAKKVAARCGSVVTVVEREDGLATYRYTMPAQLPAARAL